MRASNSEVLLLMAELEALGEIRQIPPAQLDPILKKARDTVEGK